MRRSSSRTAVLFAQASLASLVSLSILAAPRTSHATGAVLPHSSDASADRIDVRFAIARTPHGSTRWTEITVQGGGRSMWLVPARPGAALDWSSQAWLGALEEATAVRVTPPFGQAVCMMPTAPQKPPPWTILGKQYSTGAAAVHTTEAQVRAHAAARGFVVTPALAGRITSLYAKGSVLVSFELSAPGGDAITSPTLRVSDDGPGELPFELSGSSSATTRISAFAIGAHPFTTRSAVEIPPTSVRWTPTGSTYTAQRSREATSIVRESASREALFDGYRLADMTSIPSLTDAYFEQGAPARWMGCQVQAKEAASRAGKVGTSCATGALARVPGSGTCDPTPGEIDPAGFVCEGLDDLALALAGGSPRETYLTRFVTSVGKGAHGDDVPLLEGTAQTPIVQAGAFQGCEGTGSSSGTTPINPPSEPGPCNSSRTRDCSESVGYVTTGGCGGSSEPVEDDSDSCSGGSGPISSSGSSGSDNSSGWDDSDDDDSSSDDSSDDDSSGWDDSDDDDSSSDDSSGWDSSDSDSDSDSSGDSCGGGSSSSSSSSGSSSSKSDSCGGSSSSSSSSSSSGDSDDGWDDSDMTTKSLRIGRDGKALKKAGQPHKHKKKKHKKPKNGQKTGATKKRSQSPVSRYALFAVALLLPLRRRLRGGKSENKFGDGGLPF